MNITFLGAGVFGQALANVAKLNKHCVNFYDPYKYPDITLAEAIKTADILIYVAPSSAAPDILPELPADKPLICASKGFLTMKPFERFKDFAALGGAAFAKDFEKRTATVPNREGHIELTTSSELAQEIFQTGWLDIDYSWEDPVEKNTTHAILLCGALKNLFALGAGLLCDQPINLDIYNYGKSPASDADFDFFNNQFIYYQFYPYLEKARVDLRNILIANDADPDIQFSSCGVSDIALSCTPASRNFRCGQQLRRHEELDPATTVEGLSVRRAIPNTPELKLPKNTDVLHEILAATEDLL